MHTFLCVFGCLWVCMCVYSRTHSKAELLPLTYIDMNLFLNLQVGLGA